jgi:hypothetical protein
LPNEIYDIMENSDSFVWILWPLIIS